MVEIKTIDGRNFVFLVNGHRLKVYFEYFEPLTNGDFMQQVQQQFEKELVGGNTNLLKIWFFLFLIKNNNKRKNNKKKVTNSNFPIIIKINWLTLLQKYQLETQHAGRKIEVPIKRECYLICRYVGCHQEEECSGNPALTQVWGN